MVEELKSHLLRRPFADIFNNLRNPDEKDNPIGLMLMCILDYQADKLKFYTRIAETQHPKLLLDLMGFRTYKSFFYYEYQNHGQLENKYLKCKFCDLYGPYVLILTHMTISHDEHIGLVYCAYCNETDLKTHFNDGSMQTCYERYKQKPDVADVIGDNLIPNIVKKFYDSLKNLSMLLGVHTRRYLHSFTGIAYGWLDPIFGSNARYEVVFRQRKVRKTISKEKLNTFAKNVWMQFYGRPIPISIWVQNDDATAERSTRSNRSNVNSQVICYENAFYIFYIFQDSCF